MISRNRGWRYSRAWSLLLAGLVMLLATCRGNSKDGATAPPLRSAAVARFTLSIARTAGTVGTPASDSVVVDSGQAVAYSFQAASGYLVPTVLLDGLVAPASGSILMTAAHELTVGATPRASGTLHDSSVANTTRSVVTASNGAVSMQSLLMSFDTITQGLSATDAVAAIHRVRALAYDSTVTVAALSAADARLAGTVFTGQATASGTPTRARSTQQLAASSTYTVSLTVYFVNGINTSPADFAEDYSLFLGPLLGDFANIPHDPSTPLQPHGYYVPSQGIVGVSQTLDCYLEALRVRREQSVDWVTEAQKFNQCGDLTASVQDIASLLTGGDPSPDAQHLAAVLEGELKLGHAVVVVGHSRGTLVTQQAFQAILANPPAGSDPIHCLGFVSIASPLWQPTGWGTSLSWGTIAAGQHVSDLMIQVAPGTPKAPVTATDLTSEMDEAFPPDKNTQGLYLLITGLQIHALSSYVSSTPIGGNIQQAVKDVATQLQSQCALRTPSSIALTSSDYLTGPSNTTLSTPAVFTVSDAAGRPVSGATVHFAVQSGSLIAPDDQTTGSDGTASIAITTGATLGAAILAANVAGTALPVALLHVSVSPTATAPTIALSSKSASFSTTVGVNPSVQSFTVSNSGTGTLSSLTANVSYPSSQATGWLSVSLGSSTAPATLSLIPSVGALPAGTYNATVTIASTAPGVTNSPQVLNVTLSLSAAPLTGDFTVAVTPINLTVAPGDSSVQTITISSINGYTGTLTIGAGQYQFPLSQDGPVGTTHLGPPTVTLVANGTAIATWTSAVFSSIPVQTATSTGVCATDKSTSPAIVRCSPPLTLSIVPTATIPVSSTSFGFDFPLGSLPPGQQLIINVPAGQSWTASSPSHLTNLQYPSSMQTFGLNGSGPTTLTIGPNATLGPNPTTFVDHLVLSSPGAVNVLVTVTYVLH